MLIFTNGGNCILPISPSLYFHLERDCHILREIIGKVFNFFVVNIDSAMYVVVSIVCLLIFYDDVDI